MPSWSGISIIDELNPKTNGANHERADNRENNPRGNAGMGS